MTWPEAAVEIFDRACPLILFLALIIGPIWLVIRMEEL